MLKIENLNDKNVRDPRFEKLPFHSKPFHKKAKHFACSCSILLAVSVVLAGFFPGYFYYKAKTDLNTVVVKGLSEMDVKADLAVWEMKYVVTGNDVTEAERKITEQTKIIKDFLHQNGFKDSEITTGRLETNDLNANPYGSNERNIRFILNQTVVVKSENVDLVADVLNKSGDLVKKGIIFTSEYGSPVSYLFTKLNDIKPEMLEKATKNAIAAAEQFAQSSNSRVGRIKYANQGMFTILPREQTPSASETSQINKTVRVVSTIEYWLK